MFYFIHPQLKLDIKNISHLILCFWGKKNPLKKLEKLYPERNIYLTDMGRSAFRLIVEKLNLQNSEIIMPGFICDIFSPILKKYSITPKFADIDIKTFNATPEEIKKNITPKTKAVLVVHTFGKAAEIDKIKEITQNKGIYLIEDCAHAFGAEYKGKKLGTWGEASFFSFYKIFPTFRGGMALISPNLDKKEIEIEKTYFSFRDIFSLFNCFPIFAWIFKKFAGKAAVKNIKDEKIKQIGEMNQVSQNILNWQLKDLTQKLKKRKRWALSFIKTSKSFGFQFQETENNSFTFLSALTPKNIKRDEFALKARKFGLFPTRIWRFPITKSLPGAKEAAERIINFPIQNFYNQKDINKIIRAIKHIL